MPVHPHVEPALAGPAPARSVERSIRVVLADDHTLMRRHLRGVLDREDRIEVVAEAGSLLTVTRHVHDHLPRVLVIDLSMSNGSSIEAIGELRERVPGTEIVVLTMEESAVFAQQALEAGAIGFVVKHAADAELAQAVRSAACGEEYVSPRVGARLASVRRSREDGLSPRETEVLAMVAYGHTSAEIAGKLHVSSRTVETQRARIHHKLGLSTRAELVRHALRRGLLET